MPEVWVSPIHKAGQFGASPTLDQKIEIFAARVVGWQIGVAEEIVRQFRVADAAGAITDPMRQSGFVIVSAMFSYFEMIAEFVDGSSSQSKSKKFFKRGFKLVYPSTTFSDYDVERIYYKIRCGMYHDGLTRPTVVCDHKLPQTFLIDATKNVHLNPLTLVSDIRQSFDAYLATLQNPSETKLRADFLTTFDSGTRSLGAVMAMGSGSYW